MKQTTSESRPLRLAILQRVIPAYRTSLFRSLSSDPELTTLLFIGDDVPNSKVRSTSDLNGINFRRLRTRFIKIGRRIFPWHFQLVSELKNFNPDVILCEGESNFLGYLQAIWYRLFVNKKASLIHWCFISLPGEPLDRPGILGKVKAYFRKYFDAFLLYSSFSKDRLIKLGVPPEKTFVATNVGDVTKFLSVSSSLKESAADARQKLQLPEKFTVLYTGTLNKNKRPEIMLELAKLTDKEKFNFILLGEGQMLDELRKRIRMEKLTNVFIPGRVVDELPLYYRASNALLIPGRGGIIISEAMAFGIPIVVHQADGTEYDLVKNLETGLHLKSGDASDFHKAILLLQSDSALGYRLGNAGKEMIKTHFTTNNMISQIKSAASFAKNCRTQKPNQWLSLIKF